MERYISCEDPWPTGPHEEAYILETVSEIGLVRGGEIFWTLDSAKAAGERRGEDPDIERVRILPMWVFSEPVWEFGEEENIRQSEAAASPNTTE